MRPTLLMVLIAATSLSTSACANKTDKPDSPQRKVEASEETSSTTGNAAQEEQADGDEPADTPADADSAKTEQPADYPFDHLWVGHIRDGRVYIDIGADAPYPDKKVAYSKEFPAEADYLPDAIRAPWRDRKAVDVVTPDGSITLQLENVNRATVGPPSGSDTFYAVVTEESDQLKKTGVEVTLVAPAGQMAKDASYRGVTLEEAHAKAVPKLQKAVMESLQPAERTLVKLGSVDSLSPVEREKLRYANLVRIDEDPGLDAKHFATLAGKFPAPNAHFVVVNAIESTDGVGGEFDLVRVALLATQTGEVTETLVVETGPEIKYGHPAQSGVAAEALIDADGDGVEGVLYEVDGSYHWVDFVGDRVVKRELSQR